MRKTKDYLLGQSREHRLMQSHDLASKATIYTSIKIRLTDALKLNWRERGKAELLRNSIECKAIFK
jgi:hypothetical protein